MAFKAGSTIALCGAFYQGDIQIADLSAYTVRCKLSTIERRLLQTLDDRVSVAQDGSVCAILDPEDTATLRGRILYTFSLSLEENVICEITKDFDIYE
jgi:hypothetical protein